MSDQSATMAELRPLLVTPVQAAAMLGVGRTTLYHLTCDGHLTPVRIGRSTRYAVADLEMYVHRRTRSSPQARAAGAPARND